MKTKKNDGSVLGLLVKEADAYVKRVRDIIREGAPMDAALLPERDRHHDIVLLTTAVLALLEKQWTGARQGPQWQRVTFALPSFFPTIGGALRILPDPYIFDAGPFSVQRSGGELIITHRVS